MNFLEDCEVTMRLLIIAVVVQAALSVDHCPSGADFRSGSSCFYYVSDRMLRHNEAREYCSRTFGGQLALLDNRKKVNDAIRFFYRVFDAEEDEGGVPTAWVDGYVTKGSNYVIHTNGVVQRHARWIPSSRDSKTGAHFRWPNFDLFGWHARCIVTSLWRRRSRGVERAGFYNVPCNSIYWTHPLCEVKK
uniref:C-type lectin domain-containing protein n=1 Tax=Ciona savignyi TaxID=51511 RepID=H2YL22_CIOSA